MKASSDPAGVRVVDRRAEDEAVCLGRLRTEFVHGVVEHAGALGAASSTGDAAAHGLGPIQKISASTPFSSSVRATSSSARLVQPPCAGFRSRA